MAASRDESVHEADRGRRATKPSDIPKRGWKDVALRVKSEVKDDRVSMVAASVAFYSMLAIFPAMIALVTLYALIADPADVQSHLQSVSTMLPEQARSVLDDQLRSLTSHSSAGVSLGLAASLLGALWAASGGMRALITAMNVAYDEEEKRGFLKVVALSLAMTLGAIVFIVVAVFAAAVLPALFGVIGLEGTAQTLLEVLRWPILALIAMLGISVLYRYAPSRDRAQWRWVSWGSGIATAVWLLGTALFSFYVSSFGSYNETYGAIGGVIVLMLWFYITGFAVMLGAEINAELEHQTARDTTAGRAEPMGERGAAVADTLGPSYAR
ncbi:MAG: YihY/virulence factor BrkB family protein [Myxococcota bacterium]|nr:YihY/virulence factor BrkB family protein [Myxococcota bacterium]